MEDSPDHLSVDTAPVAPPSPDSAAVAPPAASHFVRWLLIVGSLVLIIAAAVFFSVGGSFKGSFLDTGASATGEIPPATGELSPATGEISPAIDEISPATGELSPPVTRAIQSPSTTPTPTFFLDTPEQVLRR